MLMVQKYKTGDTAPETGKYRYAGPASDGVSCSPTPEEMMIPLSRGETFPPVKSCGSRGGAYWQKEG